MTSRERSSAAGSAQTDQADRSATGPVLAPAPAAETPLRGPARPWLLVVARGQRQLAAQLEALFRGDARIRVIEDRRDERSLLPRDGTGRPTTGVRSHGHLTLR